MRWLEKTIITNTSLQNLRTKIAEEFKYRFVNPYSTHNDLHKAIFIHIPKTGGLSVSQSLFGEKSGHAPIMHYELYDDEKFKRYFKFCFVRNPWDRLVSAYEYLRKGGMSEMDRIWADLSVNRVHNFEEFIDQLFKNQSMMLEILHFKPQYKFLIDHNGHININHIAKLENIKNEFNYLKKSLSIESTLLKKNTNKSRGNYKSYYNKKSEKVVSEIYRKDIEVFGYEFNE